MDTRKGVDRRGMEGGERDKNGRRNRDGIRMCKEGTKGDRRDEEKWG